MLSVVSVVAGAFRLVKARPGAVAAWAAVYLATTVAVSLALRPYYRMQIAAGGDNPPDVSAVALSLGTMLLVQLAFFMVMMVLFVAAQRAVLRPDEPGFAYLRFGGDELRQIGYAIFFTILFYLGTIILVLILGIVLALFLGATGDGAEFGATGAGALVAYMIVGFILIGAAWTWLGVRLSLVYPLSLIRGKFVFAESWRLTRGRFWTLFGAYLIIFLVLAALWLVVIMATAGPYIAELMRGGFDPAGFDAASRAEAQRQLAFDSRTVLGLLLGALIGALSLAISGGAVATAARELAGTPDAELVEAFA